MQSFIEVVQVRYHPGLGARTVVVMAMAALFAAGCSKKEAPPQQAMRAMPVQVENIAFTPVPVSDEYVATIKSRRSATIQPQVDGNITKIFVKSGDRVKAGQPLLQIDPLKQETAVTSQRSTAAQKKATYDYTRIDLGRQKALFEAGVVSRQAYDQAEQAFENAKADYEANVASTDTQVQQLRYYRISAPFDGIVGDIPVRIGDYVSSTTQLTTVDQMDDLEAYIYVPTVQASELKMGLPVNIKNNNGDLLQETKIDFISPQVDNSLQGILVKAPVASGNGQLRNSQLVQAQIIWAQKPAATVPVLAISHINGQAFVFVAKPNGNGYVATQKLIQVSEPIGNNYVVKSGLEAGDKVIISGTQMLVNGVPVQPLG